MSCKFIFDLCKCIYQSANIITILIFVFFVNRELRKKDDKCEISVSSFEYLAKTLAIAGSDRKMAETRACLESKYLIPTYNFL